MEVCPNCDYTVPQGSVKCPYCGCQLTRPLWQKLAAWALLLLVIYGFFQCNFRLMRGLDGF